MKKYILALGLALSFGVHAFDVKAIKHGIANLIATIEKSLTIADKGKAKRG